MRCKVRRQIRESWARFVLAEGGTTAVEFAIVAGPLVVLIGCICELGVMLFAEYVLQNSVQDAARDIRIGNVIRNDETLIVTAAQFVDAMCSKVEMFRNCGSAINIDVRNAPTFTALAAAVPSPINVGPGATGGYTTVYKPGISAQTGSLIATYDWNFVFPFMEFMSNVPGRTTSRRLVGIAVFKNEKF